MSNDDRCNTKSYLLLYIQISDFHERIRNQSGGDSIEGKVEMIADRTERIEVYISVHMDRGLWVAYLRFDSFRDFTTLMQQGSISVNH